MPKLVSLDDVERTFESGGHPSGSADRKIHERYLQDVIADRMSPEALLFYGSCLEPGDLKFIVPWIEAMRRLIARDPSISVRIRLRHDRSFADIVHDSRKTGVGLHEFMLIVGKRLRDNMKPEHAPNPRLEALVKQLDCSCS